MLQFDARSIVIDEQGDCRNLRGIGIRAWAPQEHLVHPDIQEACCTLPPAQLFPPAELLGYCQTELFPPQDEGHSIDVSLLLLAYIAHNHSVLPEGETLRTLLVDRQHCETTLLTRVHHASS